MPYEWHVAVFLSPWVPHAVSLIIVTQTLPEVTQTLTGVPEILQGSPIPSLGLLRPFLG
jgi:hypothetical protein